PGVKKIWPVVQYDVPTRPGLFALDSQPAIPQFAHNLTGVFDLQQKFPEMIGKDILVGVVDSGIDWKHPAFAVPGQKCETFKGPGCRVVKGWDFTGDDSVSGKFQPDADPMDCNGHGTHVAGIIGGNDNKIRGVAPGVLFGAYRVFG
ncbi:peptidase S8/S53 domain-containing protein, partial [Catenaria anguillulae PL171]